MIAYPSMLQSFGWFSKLIRVVAVFGVVNSYGFVFWQDSEAEESEVTEPAPAKLLVVAEKTQTPEWFETDVDYDPDTKMAFVRTPQSYLTREEARICLAGEVR